MSTHMFVVGIVHVCEGSVHVTVCVCMHVHTVCVCIAIVHIPTVLILAICYIRSFMVGCKTAKVCQVI